MKIKEKTKEILPIKDWDSYYVVADFDGTLTNEKSKTSWSILSTSPDVPEDYVKDRNAYYDIYRPIEIDETMDPEKRSALVKEWFQKHIELFIKYELKEELFIKAARDLNVMEFRTCAREFLDFLKEHNIPLIIISAGIGNFIECFLKNNNCYYDNIYVSSNKVIFTDGIASGVDDNIIHSLNKNEVSLPEEIKNKLKMRKNVILLADQKSDLNMVNKENHDSVTTVVFMKDKTMEYKKEYEEAFDIILDLGEDYDTLMNELI